jgi:hypothetical protein
MRRASVRLLLCVMANVCGVSFAHAETAVLLRPKGDDSLNAERQKAHEILAQALQAQGLRVIPQADAAAKLGNSAASDCDSVDCAPALIEAADADVAAALAVWAAGDPPTPSTVFVTLVGRRGDRYPGKARVQNADLARATKDALLDARSLQLLGPGPWLRVRGKPEGANVILDGKLVGTVPYRATASSGRHTLEVRFEGLRSHTQTVDIPPNATRQIEIEADLAARPGADVSPNAAASAAGAPVSDEATTGGSRPIVGPIILGSAGLVLLIVDVAYLGSAGCREHDAKGVCLERGEVDKGWAIAWGAVGLGAIGGALLWHLLGRQDHAQSDALSFRVGPTAASVSGRF